MSEENKEESLGEGMSFLAHLMELRKRVVYAAWFFGISFIVCYGFRNEILDVIKEPVLVPLNKYTSNVNTIQGSKPNPDMLCDCFESVGNNLTSSDSSTSVASQQFNEGTNEAAEGEASLAKKVTENLNEKNEYSEVSSDSEQDNLISQNSGDLSDDAEALGKLADKLEKSADELESDKKEDSLGLSDEAWQRIWGFLGFVNQSQVDGAGQAQLGIPGSETQMSCYCKPSEKKNNRGFFFTNITEVFFTQMKAAIYASLFLSVPFAFIQIGLFLMPGLYRKEKRIFWLSSTAGYIFFIIGALFGYFMVFPVGFDFFLSLTQPGEIEPILSIAEYLSFSLMMLFVFGVVFELPLAIMVLSAFGMITPKFLARNFRYALVIILIIAAILSPPDPISMMLLAGPMAILYIVGIALSLVFYRKRQ